MSAKNEMKKNSNDRKIRAAKESNKKSTAKADNKKKKEGYISITQYNNDIIIGSLIDPFHGINDLYFHEKFLRSNKKNKSVKTKRNNENN